MRACGRFVKPFGIMGEIKFEPYFPDDMSPEDITDGVLKNFVEHPGDGEDEKVKIVSARKIGSSWALRPEGVDSPEEAKRFANKELWVNRSKLPALPEGEYFYHDLVGCRVFDEHGEELGVIDKIIETGANDVWQLTGSKGGEILIPAIKDVIRSVDVKNKKAVIRLIDGLADLCESMS
ncbi:MAG: ribosome maturation factor RimM [bacterium]|nr:MAG: ribosome maturation factor RimM [bacterium]